MSEVENYWDYTFYMDAEKRKWVKYIEGEGNMVRIPNGVYGIQKGAFNLCPELERVMIPASVEVIEQDVFARYADNVTIHCEAQSEPTGWFREEFEKDLSDCTDPDYFKKEVRSWLGHYYYTSEDFETERGAFSPHIVWNSVLFKK